MLGQAHTPRRRLLLFAAFALAVLVAPAVSGANPSHSVSTLRARDAAIVAKSRSAVLGLYSLDARFAAANARVGTLSRRTASLRLQRAELDHALAVAHRSIRIAQHNLADRARLLYEQGTVEPIEIVFGAKSIDEAVTNLDNLSRVSAQGRSVLLELRSAKQHLAAATAALASREAELAAATRAAAAEAASLSDARTQRAAYIASLGAAHRLTQQQIAKVVSQARAATVRTSTLVQTPTAQASPVSPPTAAPAVGGRTMTVVATGYSLPGHTASGLAVGWGIAAVDPAVIPLGTRMTIPGYGSAVAADTGGAVSGATIDLWFPTAAQASAWGRRTVTIVLQ